MVVCISPLAVLIPYKWVGIHVTYQSTLEVTRRIYKAMVELIICAQAVIVNAQRTKCEWLSRCEDMVLRQCMLVGTGELHSVDAFDNICDQWELYEEHATNTSAQAKEYFYTMENRAYYITFSAFINSVVHSVRYR